jgi:acyl-CoA thioester hydrolase
MSGYEKTYLVRWADCDMNGHLRNTCYSEYCIDTRVAFLTEHGFPPVRYQELGFGPVLLREEIDYLRELRLGETFRVDVKTLGLSPDCGKFRFAHAVLRVDGVVAGKVTVLGGWMDLRTRRLGAPPEELRQALRAAPRAEEFQELTPFRGRAG